jgi:rod shape-determining protein MreB
VIPSPFGRSTADLALDLGTTASRALARGRVDVVEIPTVVAVQRSTRGRQVVATGEAARKMLGKTPAGTEVIRPVRAGAIIDFEASEAIFRVLIEAAASRGLFRPRLLVAVPSDLPEAERRAVQECARAAGGRDVTLVSSAMAAAIGTGLPVREPSGNMVIDLGGGRTTVAVVSLGGIVVERSIPVGGDAVDAAIGEWLRVEHGLGVGERTCEAVKELIGSAAPIDPPLTTRIRGRDLATGLPREVDLDSTALAGAIAGPVGRMRDVALAVLAETPPELAADVLERGIVVCGGGARLRNFDHLLREATGLPVLQSDEPLFGVIRGTVKALDDVELYERIVSTP